jgi:hypothetical protein
MFEFLLCNRDCYVKANVSTVRPTFRAPVYRLAQRQLTERKVCKQVSVNRLLDHLPCIRKALVAYEPKHVCVYQQISD